MLGVEAVSDARLPVEARDLARDARWPLREGGSRELPPFPSNVLLFSACRLATRQTDSQQRGFRHTHMRCALLEEHKW